MNKGGFKKINKKEIKAITELSKITIWVGQHNNMGSNDKKEKMRGQVVSPPV